MPEKQKEELDYIPVEVAREQLGVSPGEMLMLLEAGALRCRKDPHNETIRWVSSDDVRDAVEHMAHYRQEEKERIYQLVSVPERDSKSDPREEPFFTFSDTDLMTLLLASVSYFDVERDIYFRASDERGSFDKTLKVIGEIYSRLEVEREAGRSISEIVEEIYEQKPDQNARNEVFLYLTRKAKLQRKQT